MNRFWLSLSLTVTIIFSLDSFAADKKVDIFLRDDVYSDYVNFLQGRTAAQVSSFSGDYIRRDVVDMIIAQKALQLGGFKKHFNYVTGHVNFRTSRLLSEGKLLLSFDSVWYQDAKLLSDEMYISDAVIRKGEYYAGIYTAPTNYATLKLQHLSDFNRLTAVSTPRWRTDWQTLSELPLKQLMREDEWLSQVRMVAMQWVDFVMMPLMPQNDNVFILDDIELKAVENKLLLLNDSRHFVISKKHPDGEAAFNAIQTGLRLLRQQGVIEKAYREAGFIPDLKGKVVLNQALFSHHSAVQNSFQE